MSDKRTWKLMSANPVVCYEIGDIHVDDLGRIKNLAIFRVSKYASEQEIENIWVYLTEAFGSDKFILLSPGTDWFVAGGD